MRLMCRFSDTIMWNANQMKKSSILIVGVSYRWPTSTLLLWYAHFCSARAGFSSLPSICLPFRVVFLLCRIIFLLSLPSPFLKEEKCSAAKKTWSAEKEKYSSCCGTILMHIVCRKFEKLSTVKIRKFKDWVSFKNYHWLALPLWIIFSDTTWCLKHAFTSDVCVIVMTNICSVVYTNYWWV